MAAAPSAPAALAFSTLREALIGFEKEKKKPLAFFLYFHSLLSTYLDALCGDLSQGN